LFHRGVENLQTNTTRQLQNKQKKDQFHC